jgi:hypothetical protein
MLAATQPFTARLSLAATSMIPLRLNGRMWDAGTAKIVVIGFFLKFSVDGACALSKDSG